MTIKEKGPLIINSGPFCKHKCKYGVLIRQRVPVLGQL